MATVNPDKYSLKTLHDEIDLYDRKIAHLLKYDTFESDDKRDEAARKLVVKRETLAKTARRLVDEGVEFKPNDLPRSFRPKDAIVPAEEEPSKPVEAAAKKRNAVPTPVYAGTSLDWQQSVEHYMQKRGKA
jgi:hypothetical protein